MFIHNRILHQKDQILSNLYHGKENTFLTLFCRKTPSLPTTNNYHDSIYDKNKNYDKIGKQKLTLSSPISCGHDSLKANLSPTALEDAADIDEPNQLESLSHYFMQFPQSYK